VRFGTTVQPGHPISQGAIKFGELLAAKSGGKLKSKEYGASVLGSEAQQISAMQGGIQEMMTPATTALAGLVKEFGLIDFPFTISNEKQADALLDGALGKALLAKLPEKGLIGLAFWENGFRQMTNNRRPIEKAEDVKGLKIRVQGNPVFIDTFKAIGTNPVPMAFAELYGALESRAVDAQENPFANILASKLYEVQKFASVSNHAYSTVIVLVSKKLWDKLSPAEQTMLRDAAVEAGRYERGVSREFARKARLDLEQKGMKINDVPAAELAKLREAVKPTLSSLTTQYDPALVKLYNAELDAAQSLH
jgi:tripartite ATP-independent transporter DctP family solute receptor